MEGFKSAIAKPIAERITEDKTKHTRYIGKMKSTEGNVIYWIGSSLGKDKNDLYFETFNQAVSYAKSHIKAKAKLFEVEEF